MTAVTAHAASVWFRLYLPLLSPSLSRPRPRSAPRARARASKKKCALKSSTPRPRLGSRLAPFVLRAQVVEPLVTLELHEYRPDPDGSTRRFTQRNRPPAPRASDALVDGVSDAFFVWLLHPPESFWVNLSPTEEDRVIEHSLGRTDVGKVMLEADLLLKKTAARLLHPDHPLVRI